MITQSARHRGRAIERYGYDSSSQRTGKRHAGPTGDAARYLPGLELRRRGATGERWQTVALQGVRITRWTAGRPAAIGNDPICFGLADALGSATQELDDDARKVSQEIYYPFGGTACWMARHQYETKYKTLRYSGHERDATGLYYYGFRYYAPWLGRWVSPDPAGPADGLNLFAMVRNNPVTYRDTLGLAAEQTGITNGQIGRAMVGGFFATVSVPPPAPRCDMA